MKIISDNFSRFLNEILTHGVDCLWADELDLNRDNHGDDYSQIHGLIYDIHKSIILQITPNLYYEIDSDYANGDYGITINQLPISSMSEAPELKDIYANYKEFKTLKNLKIQGIKPEFQLTCTPDVILSSISLYSDHFEFGLIGRSNLITHSELDRPLFDGFWLVLDYKIMVLNKYPR